MDLYLIRHADAVPLGEQGIHEDADRPLTATGKEQSRLLALGLQRLGIKPEVIFTSPLVRARQTTDEMLKHWSAPLPDVRECNELVPGFKRRKLARVLKEWKGERAALVGHEPDLSQLAAWLIGSRKVLIEFAKAGAAYIRCSEEPRKGAGTLNWLVTPEWIGDRASSSSR